MRKKRGNIFPKYSGLLAYGSPEGSGTSSQGSPLHPRCLQAVQPSWGCPDGLRSPVTTSPGSRVMGHPSLLTATPAGKQHLPPGLIGPQGTEQPPASETWSHGCRLSHSGPALPPSTRPPTSLASVSSSPPCHTTPPSAVPGDSVLLREEGSERKANPVELLIRILRPGGRWGRR